MSIEYYNQNAIKFFKGTINVDMNELYEPFLKKLSHNSIILDAGCGSGRDIKAFRELGFEVDAFDASKKLVELASNFSGVNVKHETFESIELARKYDGVWCCASLLHICKADLPAILLKFSMALNSNGVIYVSFKYGEGERAEESRTFYNFDEAGLEKLISQTKDLLIADCWKTMDKRPERKEHWINALLIKKS